CGAACRRAATRRRGENRSARTSQPSLLVLPLAAAALVLMSPLRGESAAQERQRGRADGPAAGGNVAPAATAGASGHGHPYRTTADQSFAGARPYDRKRAIARGGCTGARRCAGRPAPGRSGGRLGQRG